MVAVLRPALAATVDSAGSRMETRMTPHWLVWVLAIVLALASAQALARKKSHAKMKVRHTKVVSAAAAMEAGQAEATLIQIYRLIANGKALTALERAERLVHDYPNFQLAQLVYADLLAARARPLRNLGDVPDALAARAAATLNELRDESLLRVNAQRERPPVGAVPSQFVALSPRNKHAIAIDTSRSRLYLFENRNSSLALIADHYISVGKSGVEKNTQGDSRTPLGIYFITSNLDPKTLKDFYGSGALPINYPNELDAKRGKTGFGIWLHGTPPAQFSRAPLATDGCVVLANPDLRQIIQTVEIRTTPVVISQRLQWVMPSLARAQSQTFEAALTAWQSAKSGGNLKQLLDFYSPDFSSNGLTLSQWTPTLRNEVDQVRGRSIFLKDLSMLRWTDSVDTMVVTFGEVALGSRHGPTKRQYWERRGNQWKIFHEGDVG